MDGKLLHSFVLSEVAPTEQCSAAQPEARRVVAEARERGARGEVAAEAKPGLSRASVASCSSSRGWT